MALGPLDWQHVRARPALLGTIVVAGAALLLAAGLAIAWWALAGRSHHASEDAPALASGPVTAAVPPRPVLSPEDEVTALSQGLKLQPLDAEQARLFNSGIPISTAPNPPARPFLLPAGIAAIDRGRATDCLAAAIYYEAGHEPEGGQRAVAQVVLNRVRHFAYPKSVCAVVFQDADKPSACQFTFACDGSMVHAPDPLLWKRVRGLAVQALAGRVADAVGRATHYHADYVAPYWQPYLVKVVVIGQHIFYRGEGAWSAPAAFAGGYAGTEPDVPTMAGLWSEAALPPVIDPGAIAPVSAPIVMPDIAAPQINASAPPPPPSAAPMPPQTHPDAPVAPDRSFKAPKTPTKRRIPT